MRLSAAQTQLNVHCVRQQFAADAQVMLFGSGLDAAARDGGVDLLIESEAPATLHQCALVPMAPEKALNLPVDIVALQRGAPGSALALIAHSRAQPLENSGVNTNSLTAEREHLANLLKAVQRCAHFLHASSSKVEWPLDGHGLKQRQEDEALFEALAAFNERFAKLQDTLGAAMRHSALLMSEANAPFLKALALFEKLGVIESIDSWQMCRTARNLAAHDDETDYALIAEHFNELQTLQPVLVGTGSRLLTLCAQTLSVLPTTADFEVGRLSGI